MTSHPQRRRRWTRDDLRMAIVAFIPTIAMAIVWGILLLNGGR